MVLARSTKNALLFSRRNPRPPLSFRPRFASNRSTTMLAFLLLAVLALVAPACAQAPSALELRIVDAQYEASGFAARTWVDRATKEHF